MMIALCLISGASAAAQTFPALTGRVVDQANILSPATEAELTATLEQLEKATQRQLVVATVTSLEGYPIEDYGFRLGRAWEIGDEQRDDGAILLVAPNDRKVRIEVGYGLEGVLSDGLSFLIVNREILPRFRDGDMEGGVRSGVMSLASQMALPADEAAANLAAADAAARDQRESSGDGGFPWGLIWILVIIAFNVWSMSRRRGGRRRGGVLIWGMPGFSGGRSSGGGFSGGGFSGGGFSGGGGSFGGGGASGGW
ncbi:TPM domain-containing protein [Pacificimonas sp. WHA3]|uniref:TPM domain-containing protein n=1 Tax=Pacificimonas pallii TaxID=2827236 RepID=A0ABS6SCZ2_9SPHN|nr:TPM domain-containing protein [Pacificimonas pallii]MBV7255781.1 TPM domain-containing protein [Pacificimonas pallii]